MIAGSVILGGPSIVRLVTSSRSPIALSGIGLHIISHDGISGHWSGCRRNSTRRGRARRRARISHLEGLGELLVLDWISFNLDGLE